MLISSHSYGVLRQNYYQYYPEMLCNDKPKKINIEKNMYILRICNAHLLSQMLHISFSETCNKFNFLIIPLKLKNECCQWLCTVKDSNT